MIDRSGLSLKLRLIIGAAVIALVAVFAAGLAAWGIGTTAGLINRAAAAQTRIDLLSGLSARVSDYAIVGVETAGSDVPAEARLARRASQRLQVEAAFEAIDQALTQAVQDAEAEGEDQQMRTATRSLIVARMRAQFQALVRSIDQTQASAELRVHLDGFATQFSPLINEAIAEEQRDRNESRVAVDRLRSSLISLAIGLAVIALCLLALYYLYLVRPLIDQLARIRTAAAGIGDGTLDMNLPQTSSRELSHVFGALSRTAGRLKDREADVDRDRAALNQIIAARTSELEMANERLSRVDRDRRRFFADVGHELRTPLTVILAESELGLQGPLDPPDAAESLRVIHARAKRLNRRIDDLLRVARSETGELQLDLQPFDLSGCAEAAVADLAPLAKRAGMRLATNLSPAPAIGDSDWCRQVIGGLIENALKHANGASVVEITARSDAQAAIVTVSDDGPGLSGQDLDKVLDRFAQGAKGNQRTGFGVGLALARWVVEGQSGTIDLDSPATGRSVEEQGPGMTVKITLPGVADDS